MAEDRLQITGELPSWGQKCGVAILAVLLVWECLLPLSQTESTNRTDVFLLAFLLLLTIQIFFRFVWVRLLFSTLVVGMLLHQAHYARHDSFFEPAWLKGWVEHFVQGWSVWWSGQGWVGPAPFHTFWFLLSLWGLTILIRIWALERGRIFPFIMGAMIALSILDSFTSIDASGAILRVFVYGFVALAWLRLSRLRAQSVGDPPPAKGWTLLTTVLILLAVGTGWIAPKPEASWPNPVSWIPSGDERAGGGIGFRQIGYSRDDSRLGGSLQMNDNVVIEALVETPYYWRGESRDFYTGKGWHSTLRPEERLEFREQPLEVNAELFQHLAVERNRVFSSYVRSFPVLFTPGELQQVNILNPETVLLQHPEHGSFVTAQNVAIQGVSLEAEIPRIDADDLRETEQDYPREITDVYLQLPDSLPDRVQELAREVAGEADNPYDVAKAVEAYLRREGGYTYELDEVPIPGEDEDFVDQFLFDTKQGYCDHFSTAMVVMLRSLDIPARWVKGFTPGDSEPIHDEEVLENYNTEDLYQVNVKNSNAHSWVEVYFKDRGWIPFEPTPGFSNPTPVDLNADSSDEETDTEENGPDTTVSGPDPLEQQLGEDSTQAGGVNESGETFRWKPWAWGAGLTVTVLGLLIWFLRYRIIWWWFRRPPAGDRSFLDAYHSLLKWLSWYQGPRRPDQTLQEYVLQRDWLSQPSNELKELTRTYEEARYGKGETGWGEQTRKLWKRVMEQLRP